MPYSHYANLNRTKTMNIHDINSGALRPDTLRLHSVENVGQPQAEAAAGEAADAKAAQTGDRVEISDTARSASQKDEIKREVEFARRAMYSMPPLSQDRAEEILDRLEQGHYNAPDVRMKLSDMLTKDLGFQADAPEAGGKAESA